MAKTKQTGASAHKAPAGNSEPFEKLTNKAEAIRRALAKLGNKAKPAEIQGFIKTNFGVEMTTKVISVYKPVFPRWLGSFGMAFAPFLRKTQRFQRLPVETTEKSNG